MTGTKTNNSRRDFFMSGGAVFGAGVAATAVGAPLASDSAASLEEQLKKLRQQLGDVEDREAIRQLHLAFTTLIGDQAYEAATELFDEQAHLNLSGVGATGKRAILQLFVDQYLRQKATLMHSAYRQSALQRKDTVTLSEDRLQATATFHIEVELRTPLQEDCTAAKMARLQGDVAARRWESGRFEAKYVQTRGHWRIAALSYLSA
jgi:hypothetical protein